MEKWTKYELVKRRLFYSNFTNIKTLRFFDLRLTLDRPLSRSLNILFVLQYTVDGKMLC